MSMILILIAINAGILLMTGTTSPEEQQEFADSLSLDDLKIFNQPSSLQRRWSVARIIIFLFHFATS